MLGLILFFIDDTICFDKTLVILVERERNGDTCPKNDHDTPGDLGFKSQFYFTLVYLRILCLNSYVAIEHNFTGKRYGEGYGLKKDRLSLMCEANKRIVCLL